MGLVSLNMDVHVDEPGQEHPAFELDHARPLGGRVARGPDALDHPVGDEDGGAVADRRSGAVEQSRPGQPQAARGGRRRGEQRRMAMGHGGAH